MSRTKTETLGMRLLIWSLMPRSRPASRLYLGPKRWIFNALEVNNPPRKMTKTLETMKRISLPRILLLIHYQMGPNPLWHILKRTRTVVLAKEDANDKAKARILLPLASIPPPSWRTRTKIRTKKTYLTLSATLISRKVIMLIIVPRESQKTSFGHDNFHVGDWR